MRTILSLLGITIGILCIISIMTVIDSMKQTITSSIESLGGEVIFVEKFPWEFSSDSQYPWWKYINRPDPKYLEFKQIQESSSVAKYVAFSASIRTSISHNGNTIEDYSESFISYDYDKVQKIDIKEGRYFTPIESNYGSNVAIIGNNIAEELFPNGSAIGQEIKVDGHKLTVIGVLNKQGEAMMNNNDFFVFAPLNFGKSIYHIDNCNPRIFAIAKDSYSIDELYDELTVLLRGIRRIPVTDDDNFALNRASTLTSFMDSIFKVLNTVGFVIGGFSIIVGAFGIANIMFVSVKERTKEIGIQKAIGAKFYFILLQFLCESVVLCLLGGIVGLIFVQILITIASSVTEFNLVMSGSNILIGILISTVVGFLSGLIPAWKAASLNPVVAINKN